MRHIYQTLGWLLLLLAIDSMLIEFFPYALLKAFLGVITLLLLIAAILTIKSFGKWVAITLTVSGIIIYLFSGATWKVIVSGFAFNVGIIGILLVVPFIGIAIHTGGYLEAIRQITFLQRKKGKSHAYKIANLLIIVLSPFLNLGAVYIVHDLAHKSLDRFHTKRMGMVIYRGFATSLYWSPFSATLILSTSLLGVQWSSILALSLIGVVCHVGFSVLSFKHTVFKNDIWVEQSVDTGEINERQINKKIAFLIVIMLGLIVSAVILEMISHISMFGIIMVLAFGYSLLWMILMGKVKNFIIGIKEYINKSFFSVRNEVLLFVSAGFFASAVSKSPLNQHFLIFFEKLIDLPILFFIVILFTLFILAGMVGIHGVVLITLIGTSIDPHAYGWSPYFLSLALIFCGVLYNQTSPFSAINVIISNLTGVSNAEIMRKNLGFTIFLFFALTLTLWLLSLSFH